MEHMILASGEFIVLVPNGINLKYCFYQLISDGMTKNLDSIVESVTKSHQRVRPEKVLNTQFIEPLKDEIEEIVSFLDNKTQKIDSLIKKTKKKIELLKEQRISLINHCVAKGLDPNVEMKDSGVEWIGEIPSGWEVRKLKYFSDVFSSSVDRHIYENELQVSICHYPDVYNNEFINENVELNKGSCSEVEFDRFHLKEGFVILTKDSESPDDIGIPCYVETNLNNVVCGYHLFVIIKNKNYINSKFLFRFIQSDIVRCHFEVNSKGITRFGLSKSIIENLFVDLPPIPEQQLIADYLDEQTQKIDTTIEKETQRIELLKEYRQSLISEVVTGKIDVRDEVVV
jgi:type I restriction enzyme, S subunit